MCVGGGGGLALARCRLSIRRSSTAGCSLHQSSLLSSVLLQIVAPFFTMSSYHRLHGRALFLLLGCQPMHRLVHLLHLVLTLCSAYFQFCYRTYSIALAVYVLFMIYEHGALSCSFIFKSFTALLFGEFLAGKLFGKRPCPQFIVLLLQTRMTINRNRCLITATMLCWGSIWRKLMVLKVSFPGIKSVVVSAGF